LDSKVEANSILNFNDPTPLYIPFFCCLDFPSRGPEIVVGRPEYQAGEQVGASCTVPASNPFSTLAWYINDEPVST